MTGTASAGLIEIEVVDSTSIELVFSGVLTGPEPVFNAGILLIDTPVPSTVASDSTSITGDAMIGSLPLQWVFSGYDNTPYDGTLQLRNALNGDTPFSIGDLLSGSAIVTFNTDHEMTQSMFDGAGLPVYWGRGAGVSFGTIQGSAMSPSEMPVPATLSLLGLGLAGLGWTRRQKVKKIPS